MNPGVVQSKAGCLSCPNLALKAWGILESCWTLVYIGIPMKLVFTAIKDCHGIRIGELTRGSGGKQARFKVSSSTPLYLSRHQRVQPRLSVGLLTSNLPT